MSRLLVGSLRERSPRGVGILRFPYSPRLPEIPQAALGRPLPLKDPKNNTLLSHLRGTLELEDFLCETAFTLE